MRCSIATVLFVFAGPSLPAQSNARYSYWIDGPCGETILGAPGSVWDDGTGGEPFFDGEPLGHTVDVILTTEENPWDEGVYGWQVAVGVEGPVRITGASVNGTAACVTLVDPFPECRRLGVSFEATDITGPPDGVGPQTEDNVGVASNIVLGFFTPAWLPPEGSEKILKFRLLAQFPPAAGEVAAVRLFFACRIGPGASTRCPSVSGPVGPEGGVTPEVGAPPLTVVPCEFFLEAAVASFRRCDPNDDGRLNLTDPVWIFTELFRGGVVTRCPAAADCNGDGERNLTDGIYALRYLFTDSPPPPSPFPDCGRSPEEECPPGSTRCP